MKALLNRMCSFLSGEGGPRAAVDDGTSNDTLDSTRGVFPTTLGAWLCSLRKDVRGMFVPSRPTMEF